MGNRFLSSAGVGKSCVLPIQVPSPSPTLDKNLVSMGPGILSSIGVGVWRKAPETYPDSNATLDTFQSLKIALLWPLSKRKHCGAKSASPFSPCPFSASSNRERKKNARSFSDRSFFMDVCAGCPCQNAYFSKIWRAWPKFSAGCPQGYPPQNFLFGLIFRSCSKPTTEFAQPRLSRVKRRSSPVRGYKFGCVCSYMAGYELCILLVRSRRARTRAQQLLKHKKAPHPGWPQETQKTTEMAHKWLFLLFSLLQTHNRFCTAPFE